MFYLTNSTQEIDLIFKGHLKTSGISILSLDRVGIFERPRAARNCLSWSGWSFLWCPEELDPVEDRRINSIEAKSFILKPDQFAHLFCLSFNLLLQLIILTFVCFNNRDIPLCFLLFYFYFISKVREKNTNTTQN